MELNNRQFAITWWNLLSAVDKQLWFDEWKIHTKSKYTFQMFSASSGKIEECFLLKEQNKIAIY